LGYGSGLGGVPSKTPRGAGNSARSRLSRRLDPLKSGGKIQARHPSVNDLYEVSLRDTAEGVRLSWQVKEERKSWRESREGAYLLRTNLQADTAEELWSKYMQLTEAEAAFRALIETAAESRVYALWVTLKHLLRRRGAVEPKPSVSGVENAQPFSPMRAL
jgi:hypothetical protein